MKKIIKDLLKFPFRVIGLTFTWVMVLVAVTVIYVYELIMGD